MLSGVSDSSDLVSGVYEGGVKVWECTFDLIDYLHSNKEIMKDRKIMELGCGQALPSIFCL